MRFEQPHPTTEKHESHEKKREEILRASDERERKLLLSKLLPEMKDALKK